jgi:hypothetical protein
LPNFYVKKVAYILQFVSGSIMTSPLLHEKVWLEKDKCDEAERLYYENLVKVRHNLASQKVQFME